MSASRQRLRNYKLFAAYMVFVFINIAVNRLVKAMGLPLYVDNIGTLSGAVFGGYLPGMLVGYITNVINATADAENLFYAGISVLIAMMATFFAHRGFYDKFYKALITVPFLAFIGGVVGSGLTWMIYGPGDVSLPMQLFNDFKLDLVDKFLTVAGFYLLKKLIPEKYTSGMAFTDWHQKPMTGGEIKQAQQYDLKGMSLSKKISILISVIMIFISLVTTLISFKFYREFALEQYAITGDPIARMAEISFLGKILSLFLGFFLMIMVLFLWFAEYRFTYPIAAMTFAASDFDFNDEEKLEKSLERLKSIDISTADELEKLYDVLTSTISNTVVYFEELTKKSEHIERMQDGLIYILADLVESRDKYTGDHIRKTAAYVELILELLREDGIYADQITDDYIKDVCHSAPLHDVGKIKVPDAILNKPGRLTDEEFGEMKKHTTAGSNIIDGARKLSGEDGYLAEAQNLAAYHHEKWDGSGYPNGLKGEDIPLSARIMAVADVFDALMSKRSYKEPFSFDKAMQIIEEGSGTHFDPLITKVFSEHSDRVMEILKENERQNEAV